VRYAAAARVFSGRMAFIYIFTTVPQLASGTESVTPML